MIAPRRVHHAPALAAVAALTAHALAAEAPVRQTRTDAAITAALSIDRASLTTAERATLTLDTSLRKGFRLRPIDAAALAGTEWEIRPGAYTPARTGDDGRSIQRTQLILEPLGPGKVTLPALKLEYLPEGGDEASVRTIMFDPVTFTVASVLAPGEEAKAPAERREVVDPPPDWRRWAIGGAGAAAALAAAVALIAVAVRRRRARALEPVRRPAHELALERLEALLASALLPLGRYKEFQAGLSSILRQYIEDRFEIHAPDRTTEEFLAEVRAPSGPGANLLHADDITVLSRFLTQCDLVKFAGRRATESEAADAARTVREFIERTRSPEKLVVVGAGRAAPAAADHSRAEAGA